MKPPIAITIVTFAAVMLYPALSLAAPAEDPPASWFSLIFYTCNFILFAWLIARYGWPFVTDFFVTRARTIRGNLAHAEQAFKEAQELAARAAERIAQLESEKTRIASELGDETVYLVGRIRTIADETVKRISQDSELTTAGLREAAQRRLRQSLAAAAGQLARELLSRNFQASDQNRLLEGFIERIGEEARQ